MNNKLGLVSISFRSHSVEEIITAMKNAGLTHIEWGSDVHAPKHDIAALEKIALLQKEQGIICSSYGTYFYLGTDPVNDLAGYISAAKILGTNIIRLWCGNKNSEDYSAEEKNALFNECRAAAKIAEEAGAILCMECHIRTYTNRKESALELMQEVNSPNFRMYWQPNQFRTEEENVEYAKLISPYTVNIHVFNWKETEMYPLKDAKDIWKKYLSCFDGNRPLLLEFMPDGRIETLMTEAEVLKEIAK